MVALALLLGSLFCASKLLAPRSSDVEDCELKDTREVVEYARYVAEDLGPRYDVSTDFAAAIACVEWPNLPSRHQALVNFGGVFIVRLTKVRGQNGVWRLLSIQPRVVRMTKAPRMEVATV